ncbi:sensor histidine kinase [Brevibacillus reuszeri]|uniref:sensor histidine kinase n=1 Tax=Brevibacillus reuszeri TaxID=54915 RepID=UPI003D1A17C5
MSRLRSRIAFHFTFQFLSLWVFVVIAFLVCTLVLIRYLVNQDLQKTFPLGAIENIATETSFKQNIATIPERWTDQLKEAGCWVQIVDKNGNVIYSFNIPDNRLKSSYRSTELLQIQDTGRFESFRVFTHLDTTEQHPYFYLLGVEDPGADQLREWVGAFSELGVVRLDAVAQLETRLKEAGLFLEIVNTSGEVVQTVGGAKHREQYQPLELVSMRLEPALHNSKMAAYTDESTGNVWLLHAGEEKPAVASQPILQEVILVLVYLGSGILLMTLVFAAWHGYRYGQPLLLLTDWFERMGKGHYHEPLTQKDRKKVFRKNGKLRMRYRLYKEVIDGFYDMATKLETSEKERIRLEKTREEWMTGISHDLRTPLATIQGYGHLLESGQFSFSPSELTEMGAMIRSKGDYMVELLQDFSLTFQLKNNHFRFEESIELNEFVRRAVLRYVNDATIQQIDFIFEEHANKLFVKGNTKWFGRMLDNLIMNAIKHNPPGTRITLRTGTESDCAWIAVEDNGIGMDEETQRKLFERYYRGTNTEESTEGAGLGMSIAKAVVDAHHGTIKVESEAGTGTKILLLFPRLEGKI